MSSVAHYPHAMPSRLGAWQRSRFFLLLAAAHCAGAPPPASRARADAAPSGLAAPPAAASAPAPSTPPTLNAGAGQEVYDALLTGYPYPFEVKYFQLTVQDTPLSMAYMDLIPSQPNGQTLLLLHGKNFSGAYWHATAERLNEQGYRVIIPDQIGFGKSSKPRNIQYSFHLLAQSTSRLLDQLAVARVNVIGHSMGGMLATRFALLYPERTSKLVLVNPIGLEDYQRSVPYLGVDAWKRQALKQTPDAIREYMQTSYFHGEWRPEYGELLLAQAGWVRGPDKDELATVAALTQDMVFTQPVLYEFGQLRVPTLLVIGQRDRTAFGKADVPEAVAKQLGNYPELGARAARAIPHAKLIALEGVGHIPQYEAFEAWMSALEPFLATL
jgi:pimeloyl-ACP methyl ester carboxylesterase